MRGTSAGLEECRASAALPAALPAPHLRLASAPAGREPGARAAPARPREHQLTVEPTDAGSHWATRLPSIASTTRLREGAVPKWQQTACLGGRVLRHLLNW